MSKTETKQCQNCQKEFTIEPEDFAFYEKINVPPPTFCPECRLIRRMMFRNERSLYKRKCDATGNEIISNYSSDKPFKVYNQKYWWSDNWDPMDYGRNYDWNKPFFEQFKELLLKVPYPNLGNEKNVNSEYVNYTSNSKNCYLVFSGGGYGGNENCNYGYSIDQCLDCNDISFSFKCELNYEVLDSENCYNVFFSQHAENCTNSIFLFNCRNCSHCMGCVNLRNRQYHILNQSYSKEEYFNKLKELNFGSHSNLLKIKQKFHEFLKEFPFKYAWIKKSENVSGDDITYCKQCFNCFSARESEECKNTFRCRKSENFQDGIASTFSQLSYEGCAVLRSSSIKFSVISLDSQDLSYCYFCLASSYLFGCIGFRHKQYCILNKQYTKEEYEGLVPKIIEHMNKMPYISRKSEIRWTRSGLPEGLHPKLETNSNDQNSKFKTREIVYRYGEFFPPELSPFAYNETIAQEYLPLTKEQVIEQGYSWKDPEEREIKIDIKSEDLPDHIKDVDDSIVGKVIECANAPAKISKGNLGGQSSQCTTAFKIIEPELQFYRRMNLPLPRLCPNCRHYQRLKQRNPLKLWHRKCMCGGQASVNGVYKNTIKHFHSDKPCPKEFETTYAPDRPEIVYCEQCYLAEVV